METINCAICDKNNQSIILKTKDSLKVSNDDFSIVKCDNCGLVYLNPRPSLAEIAKYYPQNYNPYNYSKSRLFRLSVKLNAKKFTKLLKNQTRVSVLEIGCSTGDFIKELKNQNANWTVCGLEMDSTAAEYGSRENNVKIYNSGIDDIEFEPNSFDVIIMKHVFEHLHYPNETLIKLNKWLRKNGKIYLVLPNIEAYQKKIFNKYWHPLEVPRHLYHFSHNTLVSIFMKNKFRLISCKYPVTPNDWINSLNLIFRSRDNKLSRFFTIKNPLLVIFFLPLSVLESLLKSSSRIEIVFEKES